MSETLKTSQEWYSEIPKELGFSISSYDGWDQMKYVFSFIEERIKKKEFMDRLMQSEYTSTPEIEDFLSVWKNS